MHGFQIYTLCLMKTVTPICVNVIAKISDVKRLTDERKLGQTHIHNACFLFLQEKKKLALQSGHSTPTLTPLLHPPTTMHLPRSTCKQSNTHCCWLVQLGEGAGSWSWRGISHPSMPSHRASWPCQPSLGETVKTFPSRGVYGVASNNRYQKPPARKLPFSQGQSLPGQERSAGDASIWVPGI